MSQRLRRSAAPRTGILLAKGPPPELEAEIARGAHPRVEYLELARRLGAKVIDFHDVERSQSRAVRLLARQLGPRWGLAWLGLSRRREFDELYLTGEDVGIPFGLMRLVRPWRGHATVVVHNADTRKRRLLMRLLGRYAFQHLICLGEAQRRLLVEEIGVPAEKVHVLLNWLDQRFYQPPAEPPRGDYILSVGMERRDYPTLQAAAEGLPCRFHVVGSGFSPGAGFAPAAGLRRQENFTLGSGYTSEQLRALYAGARFVVVPLQRVTYAAGVTAILEAMAMGKAVITTDSPGIQDYVRRGEAGQVVPAGDVAALREALIDLWDHPERCEEIGRRNRAWIEREDNTDLYVEHAAAVMGVRPQA